MLCLFHLGRKSYIRLNARNGESISISNAAIGADTTESLKNAVSVSMTTTVIMYVHTVHLIDNDKVLYFAPQ